jgi:hypothetical protein
LNPQGAKHRRILSSLAGSDPLGKFSTLFDFSTGYKATVLIGSDPKCSVLSMELPQFYYSTTTAAPIRVIKQQPDYSADDWQAGSGCGYTASKEVDSASCGGVYSTPKQLERGVRFGLLSPPATSLVC